MSLRFNVRKCLSNVYQCPLYHTDIRTVEYKKDILDIDVPNDLFPTIILNVLFECVIIQIINILYIIYIDIYRTLIRHLRTFRDIVLSTINICF